MKIYRTCRKCGNSLGDTADNRRKLCEDCRLVLKKTAKSRYSRDVFSGINSNSIGTIKELVVAIDLLKNGFRVSKPIADGTTYDLVAEKDGKFFRVEVRSGRFCDKDQTIQVADSHRLANKEWDILAAVYKDTVRYIERDVWYSQ